jgi:2',3'-cyclic-nucleotide 2'-phosphodiesterase (5'-nucleotidase family)
MKHFKYFVVGVLFFIGGNIFPQIDTLTILHFNDTHSCLAPLAPRDQNLEGMIGGISRAATFIGMTKMSDPNVITLHAGDFSIGDFFYNVFYGVPELQIYSSLGVDALTLGNHEFDLGATTLLGVLQTAFPSGGEFPILSSNLILPDASVQPLSDYVTAYTVKEIGGLKVGIFGLTTPETNLLSNPAPAILDDDITGKALEMVGTLQTLNCDVIIMLSHLGYEYDEVIAQNIPGINVIVGGHDHLILQNPVSVTNPSGKTTWIVQAGAFFQYIGKMQLGVNQGNVSLLNYNLVPMNTSIPEEPTTKAIVEGLIQLIEETYGPVYTQQIGTAPTYMEEEATDLTKAGNHDTPLGNFITDAFRWKTGTDIAIEPGGSIAMPIQRGPVVGADLFRAVGYGFNTDNGLGFRIAKFKISGEALLDALKYILSNYISNDEFFIQVSGMDYKYKIAGPSVIVSAEVGVGSNKSKIDPSATYSVSTNEFVPMVLEVLQIPFTDLEIETGLSEYQVLDEYVKHLNGRIISQSTGRIKYNPSLAPTNNAISGLSNNFSLGNYPNPFNPSTTIQYTLSQPENVRLVVYDILGKEVKTLVNESQAPGIYNVVFNAGNLASGIYFYSITAGSFHQIKKMMLLK